MDKNITEKMENEFVLAMEDLENAEELINKLKEQIHNKKLSIDTISDFSSICNRLNDIYFYIEGMKDGK